MVYIPLDISKKPDPKYKNDLIGVLDIETTGWLNAGGKIVEVGVVGLHLPTGNRYQLFDAVCKEPGLAAKDRNAWIFQNSDLTPDEVRDAPLLSDLLPQLHWVISQVRAVTAYNKAFDLPFLRSRGLKIEHEWPCPMEVSTPICKIPRPGFRKFKWPSVEEAWAYFFPDEPYVELHRGYDDAYHEAKIVHKLYTEGYIKG